jgi:toxin ParE1/3/4
VSRKQPGSVKLRLTERAIADLIAIESYSNVQWGKRVTTKYLSDLEARLQLIQSNPELMTGVEGLPKALNCYPAREHVLVFDVQPKSLVLLTVIHGSMDIPSRLGELVPNLAAEVELLHGKLRSHRKK